MKAVVFPQPGSISVERLPDPAPRAGEVVVAPAGCGICGTDLHILDGEFEGTRYPIVPGHEFAGEVVAVGSDVSGLREGDRVAVEPSIFCGGCHPCRTGRANLCEHMDSIGVIAIDGGCAEYVAVPQSKAYVLPESVPTAWGALVEPVSCAVHGFDVASPRLGDHVLIYGAGTMGLILTQLAAAHAAGSVSVVDRNAARLERARALGADAVATDAAQLDRPQGWELVIDATGAVAAIEDGFERVRRGGTLLLFGVASPEVTASFSPFRVYRDEIRIIGSMAILDSFDRARDVIASGVIDGDALLTHRFALDDYAEAIETFRRGDGVKIQVAAAA